MDLFNYGLNLLNNFFISYNNNMDTGENIEGLPEPKQLKRVRSASVGQSSEPPEYWNLVYLRNVRNTYLLHTDKYIIPDYPISQENLSKIITYRQYLRDVINLNKDNIMKGEIIDIDPPPKI